MGGKGGIFDIAKRGCEEEMRDGVLGRVRRGNEWIAGSKNERRKMVKKHQCSRLSGFTCKIG